jgi:signal transduction histidine kinase
MMYDKGQDGTLMITPVDRYHQLFNNIPLSIWEFDFSAIAQEINNILAQGNSLPDYFDKHPAEWAKIFSIAQIVDCNDWSVRLFDADSKEALLNNIIELLCPDSKDGLRALLTDIQNGATWLSSEIILKTLKGKKIFGFVSLHLSYQQGTNSLLTFVDISREKNFRIQQVLLIDISNLFLSSNSLENTLRQLRFILAERLGYPLGSVGLFHPSTQTIDWYGWGTYHENDLPHTCHISKAASGDVLLTGNPMLKISWDGQNLASKSDPRMIQTLIAVPMKINGVITGVVNLADSIPRPDAQELLTTLELIANHLALQVARKQAETETQQLFEELKIAHQQQQYLSSRLLETQEAEKRNLGLELHDQMGQILNSVKMSLDLIPALDDINGEMHRKRAQSLATGLIQQVRNVSLNLRPPMLDDMGLEPALAWLYRQVEENSGIEVQHQHENIQRRFPPAVETAVFRICQEALNNAIRHSGASQISIQVAADDDNISLRVKDNGKGYNPVESEKNATTTGIIGMQERARLLGGHFQIKSDPGHWTEVIASIPISAG